MSRRPTVVQPDAAQIAALDEPARREGAARSELIRLAIDESLAAGSAGAIDRAIVDGYRRIPPAAPDPLVEAAVVAEIRVEPW